MLLRKKPWLALSLKVTVIVFLWQVAVIVLGLPQCGHLLLNPETWAPLD